jgi:hypothetical protein
MDFYLVLLCPFANRDRDVATPRTNIEDSQGFLSGHPNRLCLDEQLHRPNTAEESIHQFDEAKALLC